MTKQAFIIVALIMIFGGCYIQGYRIITLEEVPFSHRPAAVFLSADYGKQHLTEAN